MTLFKKFLKDESGATAVEYGILLALIGVFIIGGATFLGGEIDALFRRIGAVLTGVTPTASTG